MGISPYVAGLRGAVGSGLLVLPSVSVLPRDAAGRILLVRHADSGDWGTIGGFVEPDESPQEAAGREAREEASVEIELVRLLAALGGPEFRVRYPNGDEAAYVASVFEAKVISGEPAPDGQETTEVAWLSLSELDEVDLSVIARAQLSALGWTDSSPHDGGEPLPGAPCRERRAERPWGYFVVLDSGAGHQVKRIVVWPGSRLSYQRHAHRSEHWFVLHGQALVTLDGSTWALGPGDAVDVPSGMAHRIHASGTDELVFVEVQHGDSFDEDDILRLHDDFGRLGSV